MVARVATQAERGDGECAELLGVARAHRRLRRKANRLEIGGHHPGDGAERQTGKEAPEPFPRANPRAEINDEIGPRQPIHRIGEGGAQLLETVRPDEDERTGASARCVAFCRESVAVAAVQSPPPLLKNA